MGGALLSGNSVSFCSRAGSSPINNNSGAIIVKNRKSCDRQRRLTIIIAVTIIIIVVYRILYYYTSGHLHNNGPLYDKAAATVRRGVRFSRGHLPARLRWRSDGQTAPRTACDVFAPTTDRTTRLLFVGRTEADKSRGVVRDSY